MKKILKTLQGIENFIMVLTFSIMVLSSFAQVVNRNFLKLPITWFEEAAVYCMIYMVLIGTEVGLRDNTQVAVTAVVDKFHGKGRKLINIISKFIVVTFSGTIFYCSIAMLKMQIRTGQTSPALKLPMTIPYAALTISFGIIAIVQGVTLLLMILNFKNQEIHNLETKEEVAQ